MPTDGGGVIPAGDLGQHGVDSVQTVDGHVVGDEELVAVGGECKLVLLGGEAVLLVVPVTDGGPAPWAVIDRKALRSY